MVQVADRDDHIFPGDENYKYRGNLPTELVEKFINDRNKPQIMILQGFIAQGKTRTSKEFARLLAKWLRAQKEVHTFLFDLKGKSKEYLLNRMCRELKDNVLGWSSHIERGINSADDLSEELSKDRRVFIFILDNVDRAKDAERQLILDFVENLISTSNNITIVLTSRTDVNLVRLGRKVMKHRMRRMEMEDAKDLLKETSGDPQGLEEHAEKIISMVCGSPLALMIAGDQMNERSTQLPYTPSEFVGVMTDSVSLTLDMDNVPSEDRIISRVAEIVNNNQRTLQRILEALDCPQAFRPTALVDSVAAQSGPPSYEGQIKRTVLHVVLKRSLYTLNDEGDNELESAPFLIEVLQETFCHLTSRDGFLQEVHQKLLEVLDDQRPLMSATAKDLLQAEIQLLRNQRGNRVTAEQVKELRMNVISKAVDLLKADEVDERRYREFKNSCTELVNQREREELSRESGHGGMQETGSAQESVFCCGDLPISPASTGPKKEPEACLSPTSSSNITLSAFKEFSQASATAKTTVTAATEVHAKVEGFARDRSKMEGREEMVHVKKSDEVHSHTKQGETIPQSSPANDDAETGHSHMLSEESRTSLDLSKNLKLMSLDEPSVYGSLHSNDCQGSTMESHPSDITYSAMPTIPDNQVLANPNQESRDADHQGQSSDKSAPMEVSRREPVESEWIPVDDVGLLDADPTKSLDQNRCSLMTKTEEQNHHHGDELRILTEARQLQQELLDKSTAATTLTTAATKSSQSNSIASGYSTGEHSRKANLRNQTIGQGILGPAPTTHSPSYSQGYGFPPNYNRQPGQSSTFTPDRSGITCNPPSPFHPQPPPDAISGSHQQSYNRGLIVGNQFHQEHNEGLNLSFLSSHASVDPSHQDLRNPPGAYSQASRPTFHNTNPRFQQQGSSVNFPQTSHGYSQACGPPGTSNVMSSSSFRPQGPQDGYSRSQSNASSDRYSQARWPPLDSNGLLASSGPQGLSAGYYREPLPSERYSQAIGQPYGSNPSSGFVPQGPSNGYLPPQVYHNRSQSFQPQGPSQHYPEPSRHPHHGAVPAPYPNSSTPSNPTASSDRFSQVRGPPLQSNSAAAPQLQGAPLQDNVSLPHSLRTNGFFPLQGYRNVQPSPSHARDYSQNSSHAQYGQH